MAVIDCVCPSRPDGSARHPDGDTVTLRPKLDFRSALHARNTVILLRQEGVEDVAEILASLTEVYLRVGIESWTLVDAKGKPVPVSREAVAALMTDHPDAAMTIGDEADELYSEAVISPFGGPGVDILAAHADQRLDISDEWIIANAPEAVEAILDYHYPDGRHRDDFTVARWRLQLIAEMTVGVLVRQNKRAEDGKVGALGRAMNGKRA